MMDPVLVRDKHLEYIKSLDDELSKQNYEHWLSEHLKMNGLYWAIVALFVLKAEDSLPRDDVVRFVLSCYDEKTGGFGAYPQHDAHILSTLSAVQILFMYDCMSLIDDKKLRIVQFVKSLQLADGSFQGDGYGEVDTRFVYNAVSCLSLLNSLTEDVVEPATNFLKKCENFDGAYGMKPGAESHGAQVFTVVGALKIMNKLEEVANVDKLALWLSERQVAGGGLNGRPEKLPDVCYSWWVLSPLKMLGKQNWIDLDKLTDFILECQDYENGGFSDRKDNQTDIYHTCFSLAGLSMIKDSRFNLEPIDPIYCMPYKVTKTLYPSNKLFGNQ